MSHNQKLGFELADIVLRIMGVLKQHNVPLSDIILPEKEHTSTVCSSDEIRLQLGQLIIEIGYAVNACRTAVIDSTFYSHLINVWKMTEQIAHNCGDELISFVQIKIEKNSITVSDRII